MPDIKNIDELRARVEAAQAKARRQRAESERLARILDDTQRRQRAQRLMAIGAIAFRISERDEAFRAIVLHDIATAGMRETDRAVLAGTVLDPERPS